MLKQEYARTKNWTSAYNTVCFNLSSIARQVVHDLKKVESVQQNVEEFAKVMRKPLGELDEGYVNSRLEDIYAPSEGYER